MNLKLYKCSIFVGHWARELAQSVRLSREFSIAVVMVVFLAGQSLAQTVSGTVTSAEDNSPLPGVNVVLKGTTSGVVTDATGRYTISVTGNSDVLIFSFIGFKAIEETVNGRTSINITMQVDATQLSEVVVTALGISQEKRGLGYAIQEVKGAEIAQTQRPNLFLSLQGRIAGLSITPSSGLPGSSVSINIRGVNSISGSNQPLIVVDGLPIENRVFNQHALVSDGDNRNNDYINRAADVNPNDIESISVLKGPEAAALYGQEGSNGAIIITTKKGTAGASKINYDNSFGFQRVYRFQETQKVYGRGNFGYDDPGTDELTFFGAKYPADSKIYDNTDAFFQTGTSQNHNLSVEGGTDKATYRFSANYFDQEGTIPNNTFDKLTTRLTSTTRVRENINFTTSLTYVLTNNFKPVRGANGYLLSVLSWPANDNIEDYLDDGLRRRLLPANISEPNNPFFSVNKDKSSDKTNRLLGNFSVTYDPLSWLNVTGRFGADVYSTQGNTFTHPEGISGLSIGGAIENYTENSRLMNGQLLTTAKKQFGDFKATLMGGWAFDDRNYETVAVRGEKLQLKEFNSINNTDISTQRFKSTQVRKRLISTLGSFNVSYKDFAYITITGRNDWSSTMPIDARSYFYPSVSTSFVFTELDALSNLGPLTYGKIRGSYAEVGKDAPPYLTRSSLASRTSTGGGFAYGFWGGNEGLKPERAKGYEIGTELKFFNGRIGVDLAWFKNDRIDQISSQRLSYGTGFIFGLLNGGTISIRGIELQLTGSPVATTDFEWNVLMNFSKSKSKVIELPAKVKEYYNSDTWLYGGARGSAFPSNLRTFYDESGYPYYNWSYLQDGLGSATAIGGVTYQRNQNGDILINPASGLPYKTADYLPIGDRNPDFMIGLTNSLRYKSFTLSFLLDIRKGGDVYNGNELYLFRTGLSTQFLNREDPVVIKGVIKDGNENSGTPTPNTIAVIPYTMGSSFYGAFAESDFIERDINWLRLRDITLTYALPSSFIGKQNVIRTATVFTTMTDLFMITNYRGADPMVNGTTSATNGSGAFGFDFGTLSLPRSILFGIRISL